MHGLRSRRRRHLSALGKMFGAALGALYITSLVSGAMAAPPGWSWAQQQKLTAGDGAANDYFGASVSVSGDYALIGAYGDDDGGSLSGSAYVFVRSGTTWTQQQKLTASDAAAGDHFGLSVSLSGDYALIGARSDSDNGLGSGSAYVFVRSGTTWTQQQKLTAADAAESDSFGEGVSLSGDYALIGAAGSNSGSAYVFVRSGTTWTQQQKLTASDGAASDRFGKYLSLSGDYALIGAFYDDDGGSESGSAYVFVRSGTTWTQQQKLTAADAAENDYFGVGVSLSADYALIGAYGDDDGGSESGSAYVFVRSGTTWTQQQKLTASDAAAGDYFGLSVSLSGDNALIGAYGDDDGGSLSGSAYVFVRSGTTWTQRKKLTAGDGAAGDAFSYSPSLSGDYALIGAWQDDTGSAYVFVMLCDASTAPTNGGVGSCTNSLASGSTCQPTCNSGYTVSGTSSCSAGTLTAATCSAVLCASDEYVSSHSCVACSTGDTNIAGDDASGSDTTCDGTNCPSNQRVSTNTCVACPAGTVNAAGDDISGADTTCDAVVCAMNEYVSSHVCTACAAGTTNGAGDDASGSDTTCTLIILITNQDDSGSSGATTLSLFVVCVHILGLCFLM